MAVTLRLLVLLSSLLAMPLLAADLNQVLQPFEAHYKGRANGLAVGDLGVRELKALGNNRYQLQYRAEAMIYSLEETSVFMVEDGQLKPLQYRSNRGSFFSRRKAALDFDWGKNTGRYDYKGKTGSFPLQPNAQDPLSGSIELARLLAPEQEHIQYLEAEKKKIGTNELILIDQPELQTAIGTIKTWHLQRIHRDPERKTEIWLHHQYPAIPVRVHQNDEGDEFQLDIVRFELK
ncbi:MAG: DUF3108 domain-containing protein [Gammaproteobacteria bacterium]